MADNYFDDNKFKEPPEEIWKAVTSDQSLKVLKEIEDKRNVYLMDVVLMVVDKEIKLADLEKFFQEEGGFKMGKEEAADLAGELKEKIFKPVLGYLEGVKDVHFSQPEKAALRELEEENLEKKEIEKLKGKIGVVGLLFDIEKSTDELAKKINLSFEDEIFSKRFRNIILARLKDVRDGIETKEILTRSKKIGGLELNDKEAERAAGIIEEEFKKIGEKLRRELQVSKFELPKPVRAEIFLSPGESEKIKALALEKEGEGSIGELKEEAIGSAKPLVFKKNKKPLVSQEKEEGKEAANLSEQDFLKQRKVEKERISLEEDKVVFPEFAEKKTKFVKSGPVLSIKPIVEDIKAPPPKVMGPLEELRYFSLNDFRKLADTPQEAVEKIKQKIDFLEKDAFSKKIQGIKNWRQSEIYKLYLEIGKESIEKNKDAREIIREKISQGKAALSEEEFEAIIDLNKSLRF